MGAIKWMVSLGMILIFSISIVSYVANFGNDNNAHVNLNDDEELSSLNTNLKANTLTALSDVNGSIKSFEQSAIDSGDETTRTGSQFKGNDVSLFNSVKVIVNTGFKKIFGQESGFGYILTIFIFLMGIISLLVWWKVWKGGNPD